MTQLLVTGYLLLRATLCLSEASSNASFPVNYSNVWFCLFSCTCTRQACVQIAAFVRNRLLLLLINLTLTLLWWVERARLWGRVCSLFPVACSISAPKSCQNMPVSRPTVHTRRKNSAASSGQPVLDSLIFCVHVCVGRQRRVVHVYVVCACSYASLCVRLKNGPGEWSVLLCGLLWRHPPTFALFSHSLAERLVRVCVCVFQEDVGRVQNVWVCTWWHPPVLESESKRNP